MADDDQGEHRIRAMRVLKTVDANGLKINPPENAIRIIVDSGGHSCSIDLDQGTMSSLIRALVSLNRGENIMPGVPDIVTMGQGWGRRPPSTKDTN